ncbi:LysR family transcriptional regulator [Rhodococcoides fascians]|uniref:LysR family transcriptional regulator n=1 Tax=Rhodococcoides fascians TaxID=1828 RepID=UPI00050C34AB|nr:LysR family transcriptional regulator [Rhodococcus fascians]
MRIDPSRLRFLLAVARSGGVLAAADELHVTPSAVSQQLSRLERETGHTLLIRAAGGSTLTAEGQALAEAAQEIERTLDTVRAQLEFGDAELQGVMRIGGFQSILSAVVIPALPVWRDQLPGIQFRVVEAYPEALALALKSGELDVAVFELDAGDAATTLPKGVIETPLLDEPWKLVLPAGALLSDVSDLARLGLPWLGEQSTAASTHARARLQGALGVDQGIVHYIESVQTALALVAANEGMVLLPALALRGVLPTGVDILDVPGLGTRRVVLRSHPRSTRDMKLISVLGTLIRDAVSQSSPELTEWSDSI